MTLRALFAALALLLAAGLVPLWRAAHTAPEIDVHGVPWLTHAGRLSAETPFGQAFRFDAAGLRRIEVALVSLGDTAESEVLLRLRAGGPTGPVVREAAARPGGLPGDGVFVAFDFEPLEDSDGRDYAFELLPVGPGGPGGYSPWVRYRGRVGHNGAWGYREHEGALVEGIVRAALPASVTKVPTDLKRPDEVQLPWLRALAFGALSVAPRRGEVRLELREEGAGGPPLRVATLEPQDQVDTGFVFFSFEPIQESRWKRYTFQLTLHEGARLVGDAWGPTLKTFHGLDGGDPRLQGMTSGGALRPDRDLVFRAAAGSHPSRALVRLAQRAGWRLPAAILLWFLGSVLLLGLALEHRTDERHQRNRQEVGPDGQEPT